MFSQRERVKPPENQCPLNVTTLIKKANVLVYKHLLSIKK